MATDNRPTWTPEAAHQNDLNNYRNVANEARNLAAAIRQFQALQAPPQTAAERPLNFSASLALGDVGRAVVRLRLAQNPPYPFKPLPPDTPTCPIGDPSRVVAASIGITEALDRVLRDAGIERKPFPKIRPLPQGQDLLPKGEHSICMDNLTGLCEGEHYWFYRDARKLANINGADVDLLDSQAAILAEHVESEPHRAARRERDATIKPEHIPNDPETTLLLDAVAEYVRGHMRDFAAAFAWIIDRPLWRTPLAGFRTAVDELLNRPPLHDLPSERREEQARKVLALAWLLSDPDAHTAEGLPEELATCGWSTTAGGADANARNRCLARGYALDEPVAWSRWVALVKEAAGLLHAAATVNGPPNTAPAEVNRVAAPYVIRREGDHWWFTFEGKTTPPLAHTRGMKYIATLLMTDPKKDSTFAGVLEKTAKPLPKGKPIEDVAEALGAGVLREVRSEANLGEAYEYAGAKAIRDQIQRLAEVREAAEDPAEKAEIQEEIDAIGDWVAKNTNKFGRPRKLEDPAEKVRKRVGKAIDTALNRIKSHHEPLWRHIVNSLVRGTFLKYQPSPPITWRQV